MATVFTAIKYLVFGLFGLIGIFFVMALLFGKRVIKQWEYEAEFRDANGREFGELDIELSRIEKEEPTDTFKATFKMRHETLRLGQSVQVFVDDVLILEGPVEAAGRIWLNQKHSRNSLEAASAGQMCRVVFGGAEQFSEPLVLD